MHSTGWERLNTIASVILVLMLVISPVALLGKFLSRPNATVNKATTEIIIVVEPGDTLWSIALERNPTSDPRLVVNQLREANGLDSADIFPGQTLTVVVPVINNPLQFAAKQ